MSALRLSSISWARSGVRDWAESDLGVVGEKERTSNRGGEEGVERGYGTSSSSSNEAATAAGKREERNSTAVMGREVDEKFREWWRWERSAPAGGDEVERHPIPHPGGGRRR